MDTYKVWCMSTDQEESDFQFEYEARIQANDEAGALATARQQLQCEETPAAQSAETWDWMAVRLP